MKVLLLPLRTAGEILLGSLQKLRILLFVCIALFICLVSYPPAFIAILVADGEFLSPVEWLGLMFEGKGNV